MIQVGTLVKVPFKGTGQKTDVIPLHVGHIVFLDKEILLMHDTVIGQYLDCLCPCRVDSFIFCARYGKEFGQFHSETDRYIGIFADDTAVFHCQQWKFAFQSGCFHYVSHTSSFCLCANNRGRLRRLSTYRGWLPAACRFISPCSPYLPLR
ncbi:hypothetical protein EZS27_028500 [termite gut metagenome]|uniref:Uncharacterized protein n=1 Tax=termite gut metagenome TaxID=433724 RepID=A0A5J4QIY8_9ZZZZ